jgi:hypothetical protein
MAPPTEKPARVPVKLLLGKKEKINRTGNRAIRSQQNRFVF